MYQINNRLPWLLHATRLKVAAQVLLPQGVDTSSNFAATRLYYQLKCTASRYSTAQSRELISQKGQVYLGNHIKGKCQLETRCHFHRSVVANSHGQRKAEQLKGGYNKYMKSFRSNGQGMETKKNSRWDKNKGENKAGYVKSKRSSDNHVVHLQPTNTVGNLAQQTGLSVGAILYHLNYITGERHNVSTLVDENVAELLVGELGMVAKKKELVQDAMFRPEPKDTSKFPLRPPVVTIMGHVDHGKTTLLDYLRHSRIVDKEAGGITQHIGAFSVTTSNGSKITFIDTPGHAAFSAMRQRGAMVTDLVVLVVAANEGIKDQTIEAIKHAKASNAGIVVALTKMDLHDADPEKVKQQLLTHELQVESMGGPIQCVEISAKTGKNVDQLVESIVLQADLMELRADDTGPVEGHIIEATVDKGRGPMATVLVSRGTLKNDSVVVSGTTWAKVRGLYNDVNRLVKEVGPGQSCQLVGWRNVPVSGAQVVGVESQTRANEVVKLREQTLKMEEATPQPVRPTQHIKKDPIPVAAKRRIKAEQAKTEGNVKETVEKWPKALPLVIKGDTMGTVEALVTNLATLSNQYVHSSIIHTGVGTVTEGDIDLAKTAAGSIVAFNTKPSNSLTQLAQNGKVKVIQSRVLYELLDMVKEEMSQLMPLVEKEIILGKADVIETFDLRGKQTRIVAGCRVIDGQLKRGAEAYVLREGEKVYKGKIVDLYHHKTAVDTANKDIECGVLLEEFSQCQQTDKIVCFKTMTELMEFSPRA